MSEEQKTPIEEVAVDYTKHYRKYYEELAGVRMKEVTKLAKEDKFDIDIFDEESGEWTTKPFKYREIPTKKWMELEELRSRYTDLEKIAATKLLAAKDQSTYDYAQQLNRLLTELYQKSAKYFLNMEEHEFDNSKWTQIKSIIDACNHRTIFTLPN
jgi:hypothetical protein